ncbi:MAG: hypothetical protein FWB79_05195 [Treponema sp.]|nr:hypothetical protein [Treponema sp.]
MKKFLATLFILVALAGLGLFFGWAQRGVPPDAYGVLRSRSHGTDPGLIVPGEFRWVWYKLIPTNAQTSVFRLRPVQRQVGARGALPSGQVYSAFLGIREDFSWELNAVMSFRLRPEALVPLVKAGNIGTQEDLARFEASLADEMEAVLLRWINRGDDFAWQTDALIQGGEIPALAGEIERRFPQVTDFSLRVNSARLPDFALYEQVRALHGEFVALQKEFIAGGLTDMARNRLETFARIEELEMFGALLTRFPILLEYLMIEDGRARGE